MFFDKLPHLPINIKQEKMIWLKLHNQMVYQQSMNHYNSQMGYKNIGFYQSATWKPLYM